QMPVMDGYTATRAIRRWEEEQGKNRTPVIALTAYALTEDAAKSEEAGCDTHLTKPVKKAVLLEAIRRFAAP
ncbi:MAG: response regulator, partial [Smithellaceae bacterium]